MVFFWPDYSDGDLLVLGHVNDDDSNVQGHGGSIQSWWPSGTWPPAQYLIWTNTSHSTPHTALSTQHTTLSTQHTTQYLIWTNQAAPHGCCSASYLAKWPSRSSYCKVCPSLIAFLILLKTRWYMPQAGANMAKKEKVLRDFSKKVPETRDFCNWERLKSMGMNPMQRRLERYRIISIWKTLPKALRTQALTTLTSNFGVVGLVW